MQGSLFFTIFVAVYITIISPFINKAMLDLLLHIVYQSYLFHYHPLAKKWIRMNCLKLHFPPPLRDVPLAKSFLVGPSKGLLGLKSVLIFLFS